MLIKVPLLLSRAINFDIKIKQTSFANSTLCLSFNGNKSNLSWTAVPFLIEKGLWLWKWIWETEPRALLHICGFGISWLDTLSIRHGDCRSCNRTETLIPLIKVMPLISNHETICNSKLNQKLLLYSLLLLPVLHDTAPHCARRRHLISPVPYCRWSCSFPLHPTTRWESQFKGFLIHCLVCTHQVCSIGIGAKSHEESRKGTENNTNSDSSGAHSNRTPFY